MPKIILIRPGSTDYDQERRIQGTLDIPLNEQGDSEVECLIEELQGLEIEAIYAPPCQPAEQTANAIGKRLGIRCKKLDRLRNIDYGLWQGMLIDDVRRKQPRVYRQWQDQPESVCPPEGEMLDQAEQRVRVVMAKLLKRHREGSFALVVPEPMASLVRRFVSQCELGDLWKASAEHGQWEILEVVPETIT